MICFWPEVVYDVISSRNVKTVIGYIVVNFEVAIYSSFRDIKKNYYLVTAMVEVAAAADIDDSIKWKRFRVSFKNGMLS